MPRLSLYRPEKGNDYKFIDRQISEMFQVGGTDCFIHKYLGPGTSVQGNSPTTPVYSSDNPTQIQDLLFLENRDRKYDTDVYVLRGVYSLSDIDFNLSQFGLFLQNDTIFITFHINDTVGKLGRKIISGDVIELPHLKDDFAINDLSFALKRFYVVEDVNRAAEGYSVTWYPHLYRAKLKPLIDSQEFKQILDMVQTDSNGDPTDTTLRDIVSTYEKEMQITQAVLDQAEADSPLSGYDTSSFFTLQTDEAGKPLLVTADTATIDASVETQATDTDGNLLYEELRWSADYEYSVGQVFSYEGTNYTVLKSTVGVTPPTPPNTEYYQVSGASTPIYVGSTASTMLQTAKRKGYDGYILQDGLPANGAPFTAGIAFPLAPVEGQYCLRNDYMPKRLFRYSGTRWIKVEDSIRMTMSNLGDSDTALGGRYEGKDTRNNLKSSFINNDNLTGRNGSGVDIIKWNTPLTVIDSTITNKLPVYVAGMVAEVFVNEVKIITTVTEGIDGKANINLRRTVATNSVIQWRIYQDSIKEKQSLSKALRPKADE